MDIVPGASEQAVYHTVMIDIDLKRSGSLGKSRHRHYLACKDNNVSRACRKSRLADSKRESFRPSEKLRIVRERILRLGNAYGKIAVTCLLKAFNESLRFRKDIHILRSVYLSGYSLDLIFNGIIKIVDKPGLGLVVLIKNLKDSLCKLDPAFAAPGIYPQERKKHRTRRTVS